MGKNRSQGSHKLILAMAGMENYHLLQIFFQQLRIHGHYYRTQTHQHRAQRRAQHKLGVQYPGSQRNCHHVVARGPKQVLHHFPVSGFAEVDQPKHVVGQEDQDQQPYGILEKCYKILESQSPILPM